MNQTPPMAVNRLLDYRSWERLASMDDDARHQLLEEIFTKAPSNETWEAICELFALWPENAAKAAHLAVAQRRLECWDDRLRSLTSAKRLLFDGEHLSSLALLVKSIEIYRREAEGSRELRAIAVSEQANRLVRLSIVRSEIDDEAWRAMTESPHLRHLKHLHVQGTVLGRDALVHLFRSPHLRHLECLKLIEVGLRPDCLDGVLDASSVPAWRRLDFSCNALGSEGVLILSRAPWLEHVERLVLRRNYIAASAMRTLLESAFCRRMHALDFSENGVAEAEKEPLRALAKKRALELIL